MSMKTYWEELLHMVNMLGFYGGQKSLLNLYIKGEFEGWTGRASETWETRYFITTEEIISEGKILWKGISVEGSSLEEVSKRAVDMLKY